MSYQSEEYTVTRNSTGEVVEDAKVLTKEQQEVIKSKRERNENKYFQKEYFKKEYGDFYWLFYNIHTKLFSDLSGASITRIIYLATYIDYNSGKLLKDDRKPINNSNILELLKISERQYYRFKKEVVDAGILKIVDNEFYLNTNIFQKGKLDKEVFYEEQSISCIRLFINTIRQIYEVATPESHKTLSYMFALIPYINKEWNIICTNPLEKNEENIKYLTLGEFAQIIGYEENHIGRLRRALWNMRFINNNGRISLMVNFVASPDLSKWRIFVNPKIYCATINPIQIEILGKFCEVPKN